VVRDVGWKGDPAELADAPRDDLRRWELGIGEAAGGNAQSLRDAFADAGPVDGRAAVRAEMKLHGAAAVGRADEDRALPRSGDKLLAREIGADAKRAPSAALALRAGAGGDEIRFASHGDLQPVAGTAGGSRFETHRYP
jgi:hypothetical protein